MTTERPRRMRGGKQCIYWPDHPLAVLVPKSGWVVEARTILAQKLGHNATPRCANPNCNRRVDWAKGPRPYAKTGRRALIVWHLDGNPHNLNPNNLVPACANCVAASYNHTRTRDPKTGLYTTKPQK